MLERLEFKDHVGKINDWIQNYFENLEGFPVKSRVKPGEIAHLLPIHPPEKGEDIEAIVKDLDAIILPGITHWQHPNYHAYFTANSSVESLYGEMITSAIAAQCMIWETSPAAAELEERMMDWLKKMMGIPDHMEGVIQDTASTATLVAILTAREVVTQFKSNWQGVPQNLRVYCSTQTHSSIDKAVAISGIGKNNLVKISVDNNMSMIEAELESQILKDISDGFIPCCVVSAIGTTGTVAIDPIESISEICTRYKVWHHIDAAFAGTALVLPEYRWMSKGIEKADSFVFNPHKWMFTNFDCTAYFVKNPDLLIKTFEITPEYLKTSTRGLVNDYRDWGIQLGRRFRALKLWMVIRSYGVEGIRMKLRKHINLNQKFSAFITAHPELTHATEPILNFTCFRWKKEGLSEEELNVLNASLVQSLNSSGKVFLTHTKINRLIVIRVVIGQTYVEERHIDVLIECIEDQMNILNQEI
jgi:aromatic-L-amino-acid decarboxylase